MDKRIILKEAVTVFLVMIMIPSTLSVANTGTKTSTSDVETKELWLEYTSEPQIFITIKGGLGVSADIKNIGTTDLTNINWTITLDGKLIFLGKTKNGTIPSLAVGEMATVKDFVIGFGKTGINVTAGPAVGNTTGTVILFFVFGVK